MNNLAALYYNQEYEHARPLHIKRLEQRKSTLGENHSDTVTSMNNLALLYDKQGQYKKARSLRKEFRLKKQTRSNPTSIFSTVPEAIMLLIHFSMSCFD
jgi:hypothetical protein